MEACGQQQLGVGRGSGPEAGLREAVGGVCKRCPNKIPQAEGGMGGELTCQRAPPTPAGVAGCGGASVLG